MEGLGKKEGEPSGKLHQEQGHESRLRRVDRKGRRLVRLRGKPWQGSPRSGGEGQTLRRRGTGDVAHDSSAVCRSRGGVGGRCSQDVGSAEQCSHQSRGGSDENCYPKHTKTSQNSPVSKETT